MRPLLLDRLRRETSDLHQALEADLDLLRLEMTVEEYRRVLEGFYGFYAPWETEVAGQVNGLLPRFNEERRKTPMLKRDLQFLGSDLNSIPRCLTLPDTASLLNILGSFYVLEGATLGGQLLSRHFFKQFALSPAQGCCFFSSYGEQVGHRWQAFCNRLAAYSKPESDCRIVGAAKETFRVLSSWLDERVPKRATRLVGVFF